MPNVETTEIKVTLNNQEAFYLTEALFTYEQRNIARGAAPYLPVLLLELQRACSLEFDKTITARCEECI